MLSKPSTTQSTPSKSSSTLRELIFSEYVENLYFIILVFNSETKFGIADFYLQKAVKIIKNYLIHQEMKKTIVDSLV